MQRVGFQCARNHQAAHRIVQCQICTTDARRAGAAIGLQHIAVEQNLALTKHLHIACRAQRTANQPLNFHRATRLLTFGGFAIDTFG